MPLDHACGNRRATFEERGHDLYETPPEATRSLLHHVDPGCGLSTIWEPACGPGAIARELRRVGYDVYGSDLIDYASPDQNEVRDFFTFDHAPAGCDVIVTNPPFKHAHRFIRHALTLVPEVVMLLRLAFLESERRSDILDDAGLAEVLTYRKRLPSMHRAEWEGRKTGSAMAFAWFIWRRGHRGPIEIRRISWDR